MRHTFKATATDSGLKFSDQAGLIHNTKPWHGKEVWVHIEKKKKSRSLNQNAYYWSVVIPCVRQGFVDVGEVGITNREVHRFLRDRFLSNGKEVIIPGSGEVLRLGNTTTSLSTTEMMTYIDQIAKFAAEMLGVVIPEPTPLFAI